MIVRAPGGGRYKADAYEKMDGVQAEKRAARVAALKASQAGQHPIVKNQMEHAKAVDRSAMVRLTGAAYPGSPPPNQAKISANEKNRQARLVEKTKASPKAMALTKSARELSQTSKPHYAEQMSAGKVEQYARETAKAGEKHLEAAKAHVAEGNKAYAEYHTKAAEKEASLAGGAWDEDKHPRDENGKFT